MSAPPPPTDREALDDTAQSALLSETRDALTEMFVVRFPITRRQASAHADGAIARGPIAKLLATISDLRGQLAAAEGERDDARGDAEASDRFATRHFVLAENASAERDALAGMAGLIAGTWAKALSDEQESHRVTDIMAEVGFGMMMDAGDEVCSIQDRLAAADSRAREAEARAERAEAALKPFSEFADGMVDEHGWIGREHRASISTWFGPSDFREARQALETTP